MGYYGFGNLGDEILLSAIRSFLAPHRVIALPLQFSPSEVALDRLNSFDYVILGGGGLFDSAPIPPFNTFDQWAHLLHTPISVLGLGVKRLASRFVPAVHSLVDQSDCFIVRDTESKRLIEHPKVLVAPDLTFYQPVPSAEIREPGRGIVCGVNLRPYYHGLSQWVNAISALPCHKTALPFSVVPTYDDREPLAEIVPSVSTQASVQDFQGLDIVIGTAFHSVVFAIQAGIPVVAINYHAKVRRLMEEVGLADYVLEWDESHRLQSHFERALAEYESIRQRMAAYTEHAQASLTSVLREVRSTIETRAASHVTHHLHTNADKLVTVFVVCPNANQTDIARTITSCQNQTYPKVEVVLVDCPATSDPTETPSNTLNSRQITASTKNGQDIERLFAKAGDYVTWISAGAWFAEDALALLVQGLNRQSTAAFAYSDYFITADGNIDRQIMLLPQHLRGRLPYSSCVLMRRTFASQLWRNTKNATPQIDRPAIHLKHPLFCRPATESERYVYRAACAYGRGRIEIAQDLLRTAIEFDQRPLQSVHEFEQWFQAFLEAGGTRMIASDPVTFLENICLYLPDSTPLQRKFARKFVARASLELAFMYEKQGRPSKTRRSLFTAYSHDLRLLSNRGSMWLWISTLIGQSATKNLQQLRQPRARVVS